MTSELEGSKTYNNEELAPGIHPFVVEHVQNLDAELVDLERAGITIAGAKVSVLLFWNQNWGVYLWLRWRSSKVLKILDWLECVDVIAARSGLYRCMCILADLDQRFLLRLRLPSTGYLRKLLYLSGHKSRQRLWTLPKLALTSPPSPNFS